jgi:hypothetical protein
VIVALHAAVGSTLGSASRSRRAALALGFASHLAGDAVPHRDFSSRNFELASGLAAIALLGLRRGPTHPATLGAIAAVAPDAEHLLPLPQPGGSKLFHGRRGWHHSGNLAPEVQFLVAAALLYRVLR